MNPINAVAGAASLAGQVAYLPVATVQNLMHNYNEINESTLSGAIDIIAVRQPDGTLKSTPFHVRFGRLQVVKPRDKVVTVKVNGVEVALKMKLGRSGEAYFVHEADVSDEGELDSDLAVSPIQSPRRASLTGSTGSTTEMSDVVTPPADGDATTRREIDALKEKIAQLEIPIDAQGHAVQSTGRQGKPAEGSASGDATPPRVRGAAAQGPTTPPRVARLTMVSNMTSSQDQEVAPPSQSAPSPTQASRPKGSSWSWGWGEAVPQKLSGSCATSPVVGPHVASDGDTQRAGEIQIPAAASSGDRDHAMESNSAEQGVPSPSTAEADMRGWSIFNLVGRRRPTSEPCSPPATEPRLPSEQTEAIAANLATRLTPGRLSMSGTDSGSTDADVDGSPAGGSASSSVRVSRSPSEYFDADDSGGLTTRDSRRSSPTKDDGSGRLEEQEHENHEDHEDQPMVTPREAPAVMLDVEGVPIPLPEPEEEELVRAVANAKESEDDDVDSLRPKVSAGQTAGGGSGNGSYPGQSGSAVDTGNGLPGGANKVVAEVAGLGLSLCADKLDELKSSRLSATSIDAESDDAATEEALQRHEIFERHRVSADTFNTDAALVLANPQLMVRLPDGRIYPAGLALPFVVAKLAFGDDALPVDESCGKTFYARGHNSPRKETGTTAESDGKSCQDDGIKQGVSSASNPPQREQVTAGGWFGWWKGATPVQAEATASSPAAFGNDSNRSEGDSAGEGSDGSAGNSPAQPRPGLLPKPVARSDDSGTEGSKNKSYMKSLKPSAEALQSLNLNDGVNEIVFEAGGYEVVCRLYLWSRTTKIVISDIDGTITKSDKLGHLYTFVGKDWSHAGVASLYKAVSENGYEILYLSSRAIGMAPMTRKYLDGIRQDGGVTLPQGPVIMSPDRLFQSLHREVVIHRPQDFKIRALSDVRRLFASASPLPDYTPFYSGFGNRGTDSISYMSVGVPQGKIFIINPQSEITSETGVRIFHPDGVAKVAQKLAGGSSDSSAGGTGAGEAESSGYATMTDLVDHIFPFVETDVLTETGLQEIRDVEAADNSYNDMNFWRTPFPMDDFAGDSPS